MTFAQLQSEVAPWVAHNFGSQPAWKPLLGVQEEVGELAHAYLKLAQGIRTNEDHDAKAKDAVGDIIIFLCDFCTQSGYDLEALVTSCWDQVKQRDWKKNSVTG